MIKKTGVIVIMFLLVCLLMGGDVLAEKKLKVALLTSGPVNDMGWDQQAYEGLLKVKEEFDCEIANTENVSQASQLEIIRSYANQGYDAIICNGFQYEDAITRAAREFPEVYFFQIGGNAQNGKNLGSCILTPGHSGFLPGVLAAKMTETNKIGLIGGMAIPTIVAEFEAIQNTIKNFNPDVEVLVAYTGSWEDIGKAKEAALAQIAADVDVFIPVGNACNIGVAEAAKEKNIFMIGWTRDQSYLAPDLVIASLEQRTDLAIVKFVREIIEGNFKGINEPLGLDNDMVELAHYTSVVSKEVIEVVNQAKEALLRGEIKLFKK